jgi:CHAD domain-containing protein
MRAALSSARRARLVMSLGRWLNAAGERLHPPADAAHDGPVAPTPARQGLRRFAEHAIRRRHRRLLRDAAGTGGGGGGALIDLSIEDRHRLRIDAKRLRYAVDFFSSLFGNKRVARYVEILCQIQDLLGEINDDAVAMHLLESLARPKRFADFAAPWLATRTRARLTSIERHLVELKRVRRFWED